MESKFFDRAHGWPFAGWAALIFITSSIPGQTLPNLGVWSMDKFIHSGVFGVLAFFSVRFFRRASELRERKILTMLVWSLLFCFAYGGSDELHQWFTPNRSCEWLDFLADSIGIGAVHVTMAWIYFKKGILFHVAAG